jgi:hypothetical protein
MKGPLCEHCGHEINLSPRKALLHYLKRHATQQLKSVARFQRDKRPDETVEKQKRTYAKWQGWVDWVETAIGLEDTLALEAAERKEARP